jgi:cytochrome c oxidase accessory protein FixG
VDCTLCVQVCPTGIDIRKGLQYECIGCAACVDVCDEVMDKMGYPRGLVRYDTQNGLQQHLSRGQVLQRVLRPRILIYTGILVLICIAVGWSIATRTPFKVDVVRDRSTLARQVDGGAVENVYRMQVMNAAESAQTYTVTAAGLPGLALAEPVVLKLGPAEAHWATIALRVPPETAASTSAGAHEIHFTIEREASAGDAAISLREKSTFVLPR